MAGFVRPGGALTRPSVSEPGTRTKLGAPSRARRTRTRSRPAPTTPSACRCGRGAVSGSMLPTRVAVRGARRCLPAARARGKHDARRRMGHRRKAHRARDCPVPRARDYRTPRKPCSIGLSELPKSGHRRCLARVGKHGIYGLFWTSSGARGALRLGTIADRRARARVGEMPGIHAEKGSCSAELAGPTHRHREPSTSRVARETYIGAHGARGPGCESTVRSPHACRLAPSSPVEHEAPFAALGASSNRSTNALANVGVTYYEWTHGTSTPQR
jgi:hypothetical protein